MKQFYEIKLGKTYVYLRVTTRSSENGIKGVRDGILQIGVTTIPENNRANNAIIEIISDEFKVPKSKILISAGLKSRNKTVCIEYEIDKKILEKILLL